MKIKTLAMLKMEKNFIAQEKGYPRNPYAVFNEEFLLSRINEEFIELIEAIHNKDIHNAKRECADISNLVDYLFERLTIKDEERRK